MRIVLHQARVLLPKIPAQQIRIVLHQAHVLLPKIPAQQMQIALLNRVRAPLPVLPAQHNHHVLTYQAILVQMAVVFLPLISPVKLIPIALLRTPTRLAI
jgi:hypothetical protein